MPALSLDQPWASLMFTPQPCPAGHTRGICPPYQPMVKRIETRSWPCPPKFRDRPLAIHATARKPAIQPIGDYWVDSNGRLFRRGASVGALLPLGAVIGSCRITASLPVVAAGPTAPEQVVALHASGVVVVAANPGFGHAFAALYPPGLALDEHSTDVTDQVPYGDFTPGRWAWIIEDAKPTTKRCPTCLNQFEGRMPGYYYGSNWDWVPCQTCGGAGRCEPIPAKGHQRIFNWRPH